MLHSCPTPLDSALIRKSSRNQLALKRQTDSLWFFLKKLICDHNVLKTFLNCKPDVNFNPKIKIKVQLLSSATKIKNKLLKVHSKFAEISNTHLFFSIYFILFAFSCLSPIVLVLPLIVLFYLLGTDILL